MRVIAYHLILTTYGFWLPNDPRGSYSKSVEAPKLKKFGPATTVNTKRSVAHVKHDFSVRRLAKESLVRQAVILNGQQARAVIRGISEFVKTNDICLYACAVLSDHVHLLVQRHRYSIEKLAALLKGAATKQLNAENLHPFADEPYANGRIPTPWAKKHWSAFLGTDDDMRRTIKYINDNPTRHGLKPQRYRFVTTYKTKPSSA